LVEKKLAKWETMCDEKIKQHVRLWNLKGKGKKGRKRKFLMKLGTQKK